MAWCNTHKRQYALPVCPQCLGAPTVRQDAEAGTGDNYSPDVPGTTAHLLHTVGFELGHVHRHMLSLAKAKPGKEADFHHAHAKKHLASAMDHAGRLQAHVEAHYPQEATELTAIKKATLNPPEAPPS